MLCARVRKCVFAVRVLQFVCLCVFTRIYSPPLTGMTLIATSTAAKFPGVNSQKSLSV